MENLIDQQKCKKCKLCIEVCPVNIIGIDNEGLVNFIPEREKICLECGQCMAICSTEAIKIKKYSYEENFTKLPINPVDYSTFIDFIATRRSIRNFKDKQVPKEIIQQILDSLDYAPYGSHPEKVKITVVNNKAIIEESLPIIEKFLDNIVTWMENPFIRFVIKTKKGLETSNTIKNHLYPIAKLDNYKLKYGDRISRGANSMIIFHASKGAEEHTNNSLIYVVYAMFAAHSLGLGALVNGIVPAAINKSPELKEKFSIPPENEAIISLMLGYPKYKYKKAIKRENKNVNWIV